MSLEGTVIVILLSGLLALMFGAALLTMAAAIFGGGDEEIDTQHHTGQMSKSDLVPTVINEMATAERQENGNLHSNGTAGQPGREPGVGSRAIH